MRRHLLTGITLSLGMIIVSTVYAYQSGHALNTYQGTVKDLFPQRIGAFVKDTNVPSLPLGINKTRNHVREDLGYSYAAGERRFTLSVINFASPADAKKALDIFREKGPQILSQTPSVKKKGTTIVGDRLELVQLYPSRPEPIKINHIYWTNGSVLFLMESSDSGPNRISMDELKRLEDSLSY